jgi:hypothetical protein
LSIPCGGAIWATKCLQEVPAPSKVSTSVSSRLSSRHLTCFISANDFVSQFRLIPCGYTPKEFDWSKSKATQVLRDYFSVNASGYPVYFKAVRFRSPPNCEDLRNRWKKAAQTECFNLVKDLHASCPFWLAWARNQERPTEIPKEIQLLVLQHMHNRAAKKEADLYSLTYGSDRCDSYSTRSRPFSCNANGNRHT